MALKKRKKVLFVFIIIIILVLMFSVVGIVVLYLGGTQTLPLISQDYESLQNEDIIIFEDPSLQQPKEDPILNEEEIMVESITSGENQADSGTILDSSINGTGN